MITILTTTNYKDQILHNINAIDRLNELVTIATNINEIDTISKILYIEEDTIKMGIDWSDLEPPYLFPTLTFSNSNLLAMIFYKLGNHQKALEYVSNNSELYQHLLIATHLQFGYEISKEQTSFLDISSKHNLAIVFNFGNLNPIVENQIIQNTYEEALKSAKTDDLKLFSAKHYANFLLDNSLSLDAEKLIRYMALIAVTKEEKNAMNHLLSSALMAQISIPYNSEKLIEIADFQQKSISFYESNGFKVNAGLLLINASEIANFQEDYINSKNLINKAILYFKEEDIPEFLGEATIQKATLLYTWSKNGSPQYYKPAINAFQDALKVFKRDTHPEKFADIHHNLALIYSEIQVSEKEKAIWTAFCASSFKEALFFYTKEQYPYHFAMVSHNYATALMGFPEAKLHNNLDKSFDLFEEALKIRTPQKHPFERALTLLNQLELYWLIHIENKTQEVNNYKHMFAKANEIKKLVKDKALIEKANEHLKELEKLKTIID